MLMITVQIWISSWYSFILFSHSLNWKILSIFDELSERTYPPLPQNLFQKIIIHVKLMLKKIQFLLKWNSLWICTMSSQCVKVIQSVWTKHNIVSKPNINRGSFLRNSKHMKREENIKFMIYVITLMTSGYITCIVNWEVSYQSINKQTFSTSWIHSIPV